jgi:hypothetical protein
LYVSPFVLTWNLYAGVPGLQGTDNGPRAHLGRGSEPVVGPTFLFPRCFFGTLYPGIVKREFSFTNGRVATCDSRGMLRRAKRLQMLSGAPAAATIVVDEDVDGGPPGRCRS